ncbi:MAG: endonuclease/exonuclease/phosphatase family protein [Nitriliruptoraceae bacterium]
MRLIGYNVSGGLDPASAGRILAAQAPDVVCLTEIPPAGRLRALARLSGLDIVARAGRRGTGTAILAATSVLIRATTLVPLTTPRDVPARQAAHAIVSVAGLGLSITAVQFGLRPEVRRTNLHELLAYLDTIEQPSVVSGDLNESVRSPVAAGLAARFQDAHAVAGSGAGLTYPTSDPSTRQDFVFVDPALEVIRAEVLTAAPVDVASHHRPVLVEVRAAVDDPEGGGWTS